MVAWTGERERGWVERQGARASWRALTGREPSLIFAALTVLDGHAEAVVGAVRAGLETKGRERKGERGKVENFEQRIKSETYAGASVASGTEGRAALLGHFRSYAPGVGQGCGAAYGVGDRERALLSQKKKMRHARPSSTLLFPRLSPPAAPPTPITHTPSHIRQMATTLRASTSSAVRAAACTVRVAVPARSVAAAAARPASAFNKPSLVSGRSPAAMAIRRMATAVRATPGELRKKGKGGWD